MKKWIALLIVAIIVILICMQINCKAQQETELPATRPRIMQFYFTKKQISIRTGDVTTLVIQCQHTHYLFLNGNEIPLNAVIDYSAGDFKNKKGTYTFTLRAEHTNGLCDEKVRHLEVMK